MLRPVWALLIVAVLLPCSLAASEIKIFTTLPVFSILAQEIAGDAAHINCLTHGQDDPHYLLITPSQGWAMAEADLILSGEEMAHQLPVAQDKIAHLSVLPTTYSKHFLQRRALVAQWLNDAPASSHGHHHDHQHCDGHHHDHGTTSHHHAPSCQAAATNTLSQAQHEWLCCTSMQVVAEIFAQMLIEKDPDNAEQYALRAATVIDNIEKLKEHYQQLPQPQQSILYFEEFYLLQKEMGVNFGPVLYHCCHNKNLSPQRLAELMQSGDYRALLVPRNLDEKAQEQLRQITQIQVEEIDTSGASAPVGSSYANFLGILLGQLYNTDSLAEAAAS